MQKKTEIKNCPVCKTTLEAQVEPYFYCPACQKTFAILPDEVEFSTSASSGQKVNVKEIIITGKK